MRIRVSLQEITAISAPCAFAAQFNMPTSKGIRRASYVPEGRTCVVLGFCSSALAKSVWLLEIDELSKIQVIEEAESRNDREIVRDS